MRITANWGRGSVSTSPPRRILFFKEWSRNARSGPADHSVQSASLLSLKLTHQFTLTGLELQQGLFGLFSLQLEHAQRIIEILPFLRIGGLGGFIVDGLKPLLDLRLLCAALIKLTPHVSQLPSNAGHMLLLQLKPFHSDLDARSDLSGTLKRDPKRVNLRQ